MRSFRRSAEALSDVKGGRYQSCPLYPTVPYQICKARHRRGATLPLKRDADANMREEYNLIILSGRKTLAITYRTVIRNNFPSFVYDVYFVYYAFKLVLGGWKKTQPEWISDIHIHTTNKIHPLCFFFLFFTVVAPLILLFSCEYFVNL